ncbi:LAETG motif-containing sortase-dependent surface protein [Streptomyces daliensis]
MTAPRGRWARTAALTVASAAAVAGTGIWAVPASAHTPSWSVDCTSVSVNLTAYNSEVENTVSITADGKDVLSAQKFGSEFHKKLDLPKHSKEMTVKLSVKAGDGDQYSREETKTSPVCEGEEEPEPSAPPTKPSSPSPAPSTSSEAPAPSTEPSTSAPAAKPDDGGSDLAETGSSDSTPLIAGIAGAVVLAGAALLVITRKRRSATS